MQVSVETLEGLGRKVTISVPAQEVDSMVNSQLKELAQKVKLDGFRPGKAPLNVVKQRFLGNVHSEVMEKMVRETLFKAIDESQLQPAAYPSIEPEPIKAGQDFVYHASFEILPDIEIQNLNGVQVEIIQSEVSDADLDDMIEKLRDQHKEFKEVKRKSKKGDKVEINFEGFLGDEPFEGGKAESFELELGSDSMIPGFEKGIIGHKAEESFDIEVTFPEDYQQEDLAGKQARFAIDLLKVQEATLPELNDEFASKFGIEEGGIDALKDDIRRNMIRELEKRLSETNRDNVFDAFLKENSFDIPNALVDNEIEQLKKDMFRRIFGSEKPQAGMPDLPGDMFREQAEKRVKLGLLFAEYVKQFEIEPTDAQVNDKIETLASAYENSEAFIKHYKSDKNAIESIRSLVIEEIVADKLLESGEKVEKVMDYDSVMNPKPNQSEEGE